VADAQKLLTEAQLRVPYIREGRRGHLAMAYELRIDLVAGTRPSNDQIDRLLTAYTAGKGSSQEAVIVDTLIAALRGCDRNPEAEALRAEFLGKWRRDRYPVPTQFTNLRRAG
jgi:hypothetical protein